MLKNRIKDFKQKAFRKREYVLKQTIQEEKPKAKKSKVHTAQKTSNQRMIKLGAGMLEAKIQQIRKAKR